MDRPTLVSLGTIEEIVTLHNAVATLPCPTLGTEGASCAAWGRGMAMFDLRNRTFVPAAAVVTVRATVQTTLDKPLGIYGINNGFAHWLGTLNGGAPIRIANALTPCSFEFSTGGYQWFAVGGEYGDLVTPSGGAALTVTARPLYLLS